MNLYELCDDPSGEGTHWKAVWASSPEDAIAYYKKHYSGDGPLEQIEVYCRLVKVPPPPSSPNPDPHEERDMEVLRQIGWREPGDRPCEGCDLYSLGMHPICNTCYRCSECGHDEDCEEVVQPDLEVDS